MSVKRYKFPVSTSAQKIARARKMLKQMPWLRKLELMVEAGVMTQQQADRAKKKREETPE